MSMAETVLVTGAGGFVGRCVARVLRERGMRVVAHARRAGPGIDLVADLADASAWPLPSGIVAVVHCAAAIPSRSDAFARDNAAATAQLANLLSRVATLRRVVHLSSISTYRRPPEGRWIISEDAPTVAADDTHDYAASKRAAELAFDALARQRPELGVTHVRASSIYGPGMIRSTLLPVLVTRALGGEALILRGARNYRQNFVHVSDVAELAATLAVETAAWPVVNAFSDDSLDLFALAELVRTGLGSSSVVMDNTHDAAGPEPVFVNAVAKRLHPMFRSLSDNLRDAA